MLVGKAGRFGLRAIAACAQQSQSNIGAAFPAVAIPTAQQSCWMAAAAQPAPLEGRLQLRNLVLTSKLITSGLEEFAEVQMLSGLPAQLRQCPYMMTLNTLR